MSYRLRLYPYCGGHDDLIGEGDLAECRRRASRRIRHHRVRMEYPVTVLERGRKWELESDPEGGCLISDFEGILAIEAIEDGDEEIDECLDAEEGETLYSTCERCGDEFLNGTESSCAGCQEEEDDDE